MNDFVRSLVADCCHSEQIAPGVTLRRLHPGGKEGPNGEVHNEVPGGQTWSDIITMGGEDGAPIYAIPDIRLPANQLWPMHWHDCWTVVVILDGSCIIGDWHMKRGDVFVAAPSLEYGPLLIGPTGCRLLEIFDDLILSRGGYGPEYRDHPTLQYAEHHNFEERSAINAGNKGRSMLPVDGVEGMWKTKLAADWSWDLGDPEDADRSIVKDTRLEAGASMPAATRGDWYAAIVLAGSMEVGGKTLKIDDVLIVERGKDVPEMIAGSAGVQLLENFRTSRAL